MYNKPTQVTQKGSAIIQVDPEHPVVKWWDYVLENIRVSLL